MDIPIIVHHLYPRWIGAPKPLGTSSTLHTIMSRHSMGYRLSSILMVRMAATKGASGPPIWAIDSSHIMDATTEVYTGLDFCTPDQVISIAQAIQGFVDDTANASAQFKDTLRHFRDTDPFSRYHTQREWHRAQAAALRELPPASLPY